MKKLLFIVLSVSILSACQSKASIQEKPAPLTIFSELPSDSDFELSYEELKAKHSNFFFYVNRIDLNGIVDKKFTGDICIPTQSITDEWGEPDRISVDRVHTAQGLVFLLSPDTQIIGATFLSLNTLLKREIYIWKKGRYYVSAELMTRASCGRDSTFVDFYITDIDRF